MFQSFKNFITMNISSFIINISAINFRYISSHSLVIFKNEINHIIGECKC